MSATTRDNKDPILKLDSERVDAVVAAFKALPDNHYPELLANYFTPLKLSAEQNNEIIAAIFGTTSSDARDLFETRLEQSLNAAKLMLICQTFAIRTLTNGFSLDANAPATNIIHRVKAVEKRYNFTNTAPDMLNQAYIALVYAAKYGSGLALKLLRDLQLLPGLSDFTPEQTLSTSYENQSMLFDALVLNNAAPEDEAHNNIAAQQQLPNVSEHEAHWKHLLESREGLEQYNSVKELLQRVEAKIDAKLAANTSANASAEIAKKVEEAISIETTTRVNALVATRADALVTKAADTATKEEEEATANARVQAKEEIATAGIEATIKSDVTQEIADLVKTQAQTDAAIKMEAKVESFDATQTYLQNPANQQTINLSDFDDADVSGLVAIRNQLLANLITLAPNASDVMRADVKQAKQNLASATAGATAVALVAPKDPETLKFKKDSGYTDHTFTSVTFNSLAADMQAKAKSDYTVALNAHNKTVTHTTRVQSEAQVVYNAAQAELDATDPRIIRVTKLLELMISDITRFSAQSELTIEGKAFPIVAALALCFKQDLSATKEKNQNWLSALKQLPQGSRANNDYYAFYKLFFEANGDSKEFIKNLANKLYNNTENSALKGQLSTDASNELTVDKALLHHPIIMAVLLIGSVNINNVETHEADVKHIKEQVRVFEQYFGPRLDSGVSRLAVALRNELVLRSAVLLDQHAINTLRLEPSTNPLTLEGVTLDARFHQAVSKISFAKPSYQDIIGIYYAEGEQEDRKEVVGFYTELKEVLDASSHPFADVFREMILTLLMTYPQHALMTTVEESNAIIQDAPKEEEGRTLSKADKLKIEQANKLRSKTDKLFEAQQTKIQDYAKVNTQGTRQIAQINSITKAAPVASAKSVSSQPSADATATLAQQGAEKIFPQRGRASSVADLNDSSDEEKIIHAKLGNVKPAAAPASTNMMAAAIDAAGPLDLSSSNATQPTAVDKTELMAMLTAGRTIRAKTPVDDNVVGTTATALPTPPPAQAADVLTPVRPAAAVAAPSTDGSLPELVEASPAQSADADKAAKRPALPMDLTKALTAPRKLKEKAPADDKVVGATEATTLPNPPGQAADVLTPAKPAAADDAAPLTDGSLPELVEASPDAATAVAAPQTPVQAEAKDTNAEVTTTGGVRKLSIAGLGGLLGGLGASLLTNKDEAANKRAEKAAAKAAENGDNAKPPAEATTSQGGMFSPNNKVLQQAMDARRGALAGNRDSEYSTRESEWRDSIFDPTA
jgi:hypothetical protein